MHPRLVTLANEVLQRALAANMLPFMPQPNWWLRSNSTGDAQPVEEASSAQEPAQPQQQVHANGVAKPEAMDAAEAGSWMAPAVGGERRPAARYEHAVALVGNRMFLVGGNSGAQDICAMVLLGGIIIRLLLRVYSCCTCMVLPAHPDAYKARKAQKP
jgi:hypothetical protein